MILFWQQMIGTKTAMFINFYTYANILDLKKWQIFSELFSKSHTKSSFFF